MKFNLSKLELENLYREGNLSSNEIGERIQVSGTQVRYWIKKFYIKMRSRSEASILSGGKRGLFPALEPSRHLAYLLGVLAGDGYLLVGKRWNQRGKECIVYSVHLKSKDKPFLLEFYSALKKIGLNPHYWHNPNYSYGTICAYSKRFFEWYKNQNSEKIRGMCSLADLKRAFIKGFYESDGWMSIQKRSIREQFYVGVCNTNLDTILLCKDFLQELGYDFNLNTTKTKKGKPFYKLITGRKNQVIRFFNEIKPCAHRGGYDFERP